MQLNLSSVSLELPRQLPPALRSWMLGQLLDAQVIGRDGQNSIRLNVGGTELRAATALPLRVGENLSLKVTQLKPVVTLTPVAPAATPEKMVLNTNVNRILPLQRPLAPTLEFLREAAGEPVPATRGRPNASTLPAGVLRAAQGVLAAIPNIKDAVDGKQLPDLIRQAGVTAENALLRQVVHGGIRELPPQDLKWQLLKLKGALNGASTLTPASAKPATESFDSGRFTTHQSTAASKIPVLANAGAAADLEPEMKNETLGRMKNLVESAIARIETNQLKAVRALLDGVPELSLELPVATDDGYKDIRLQVRRDESNPNKVDGETHTIALEIPITAQESVRAVVTQSGADELNVRLWSTNDDLRRALAGTRENLVERLRANGIDTVRVSVVELKPFEQWRRTFDQLVDTKA